MKRFPIMSFIFYIGVCDFFRAGFSTGDHRYIIVGALLLFAGLCWMFPVFTFKPEKNDSEDN